jgi:hypothetical protein
MEPDRNPPGVPPSVEPENASLSSPVIVDEIEPATTAELDRQEERAIKRNEHR